MSDNRQPVNHTHLPIQTILLSPSTHSVGFVYLRAILFPMERILKGIYAEKRPDYFEQPRLEMIGLLPTESRRILEVGCGAGAFGAAVKSRLKAEYWGIEPDPGAADLASDRIDRVLCGLFSEGLELPRDHFDCIIFNDVLEHLVDPELALTYAKRLLCKGGVVVASIPNICHFPTLWRLVIHGDWEYTERGILDKTHLRFFTRRSIHRLFESTGYGVDTLEGIDPFYEMVPADRQAWRYYRYISRLPSPKVKDMRYLRFSVRATAT